MSNLRHLRIAFLTTVLATVFLVGLPLPKIAIPPKAAAASFNLWGSVASANGWGFTSSTTNPGPTITVLPGESVTLNLYAQDSITHAFCVDYEATPDYRCQTPTEPQSPNFSSSTTATTYPFTATTTPGSYTYFCVYHTTLMYGRFIVLTPDFSISSNPSSLTLQQGASATSTITLSSINSFSGTIMLGASVSPSGVNPSLNQTSVTLASGASHPVTLTVTVPSSAALGTYTVTVTGTSGSLSHSTTVTVSVVKPDFTIASSQSAITINPGSSGSSMITLTSVAGFSGTIALSARGSTSGLTGTLNPASLSLASGGTTTSTLTISASNTTALGQYPLTVNGTSGALFHFVSITVTVSAPTQTPTIPIGTIIAAGGVVIIASVAAIGYFVVRARRKPP